MAFCDGFRALAGQRNHCGGAAPVLVLWLLNHIGYIHKDRLKKLGRKITQSFRVFMRWRRGGGTIRVWFLV